MTTARDREHVLEQWLKQSGGARSAPTAECLDAETAGAWADGRLRGAALAEAQLHVADCARCQALMATLLRTTPAAGRGCAGPEAGLACVGDAVGGRGRDSRWRVRVGKRSRAARPCGSDRSRSDAATRGRAAQARRRGGSRAGKREGCSRGQGTCGIGAQREAEGGYGTGPGEQTEGQSWRSDRAGETRPRRRSTRSHGSLHSRPLPPAAQTAPSAPEPQSAGAATTARDASAVQAETRREATAAADRLHGASHRAARVVDPGGFAQSLGPVAYYRRPCRTDH